MQNKNFEILRIWTAKEIEDCGQPLITNEIYVILFDFDIDGVRAITSSCHIGVKFSNLYVVEKVFFLDGFQKIDCDQILMLEDRIQNVSNQVKNLKEPQEIHESNLTFESKESTNFETDHDYNKVTERECHNSSTHNSSTHNSSTAQFFHAQFFHSIIYGFYLFYVNFSNI